MDTLFKLSPLLLIIIVTIIIIIIIIIRHYGSVSQGLGTTKFTKLIGRN